jgi:Putative transmembrane protein (PGPGW)
VPDTVLEWLAAHGATTGAIVGTAAVLMAGSAALMVYVIARMSPEYFVEPTPSPGSWRSRHPVLRIVSRVTKNILGVTLVVIGVAMLVLPGQGLLTILAGVFLLEFPGKRRLELHLVRKRPVHLTINWIRARVGRPPLVLP